MYWFSSETIIGGATAKYFNYYSITTKNIIKKILRVKQHR